MPILISVNSPNWMRDEDVYDLLRPLMPDATIHCGFPETPLDDVTMLATTEFNGDLVPLLPNLELIQKLGAGVETMAQNPDLPADVRIARLASENQAREIAEFCLTYILAGQRNMAFHLANEAVGKWLQRAPRLNRETTVGVLGLGVIGAMTARLLLPFGFNVIGWSRSEKSIDGVDCRAGADALPGVLGASDYVAAILPSTPETLGMFDAEMFAHMKPDGVLINAGRGTLIVDDDLLTALEAGQLGGAVLDVFNAEPLPPDHPYWAHPKVTVTPHVSGWNVDDSLPQIAENYRRLTAREPLLNEVDRTAGY